VRGRGKGEGEGERVRGRGKGGGGKGESARVTGHPSNQGHSTHLGIESLNPCTLQPNALLWHYKV
jgi:hypothetical protein